MPKQPNSMTTADFFRSHGWGPGTCLRGIVLADDDTIRINAVGRECILATAIARHGAPILPKHQHEHTWTLICRDWVEVPDPEKQGDTTDARIVGPDTPPTDDAGRWERSKSPWHADAFPTEFKSSAPEQGERKTGWLEIDWCGNAIGWVPDGTVISPE